MTRAANCSIRFTFSPISRLGYSGFAYNSAACRRSICSSAISGATRDAKSLKTEFINSLDYACRQKEATHRLPRSTCSITLSACSRSEIVGWQVTMGTAVVASVVLFLAMLVFAEIGYRVGRIQDPEGLQIGVGAIEGAVLALLGLILAFTFSSASSRLEVRRQLVVREANAIGTAYLRLDVIPPAEQAPLRQLFRQYLDARLAIYEQLGHPAATEAAMKKAEQLQREIWAKAEASTHGQLTSLVVLPAMNEMIDITTARTVALRTRTPDLIVYLMFGLAMLSAMVAGYGISPAKRRNLLMTVVFSMATSITVYTVMDLDNPQSGLIRLISAEQALSQLRGAIK